MIYLVTIGEYDFHHVVCVVAGRPDGKSPEEAIQEHHRKIREQIDQACAVDPNCPTDAEVINEIDKKTNRRAWFVKERQLDGPRKARSERVQFHTNAINQKHFELLCPERAEEVRGKWGHGTVDEDAIARAVLKSSGFEEVAYEEVGF